MNVPAELHERCARLALDGIHREYPNQMALRLSSDADARPPRESTPAFFGCYDWHSAVHSHWCLIRLLRKCPESNWADEAWIALSKSLTATNLAAETEYLGAHGREGFERPYGLAWLLQLAAELREWDDVTGNQWLCNLHSLEQLAVERFMRWLPKLNYPIRSGEHSQSAFAMGLAFDWAKVAGDDRFLTTLESRARHFHLGDRGAPLNYEPSGHDFLSPCLAEADLMRRVLKPDQFAAWVDDFFPGLSQTAPTAWLSPVLSAQASDGKLAHLDGLNLSRAWMLEGICGSLHDTDVRRQVLQSAAATHREAGLQAVASEQYMLTHWIGSFAVYLTTQRGLTSF